MIAGQFNYIANILQYIALKSMYPAFKMGITRFTVI